MQRREARASRSGEAGTGRWPQPACSTAERRETDMGSTSRMEVEPAGEGMELARRGAGAGTAKGQGRSHGASSVEV
jgi:hypothetical protein